MEEEAEKLKELQSEVEKQMNMTTATRKYFIFLILKYNLKIIRNINIKLPTGNYFVKSFFQLSNFPTLEEKMEADQRSIFVGNVSIKICYIYI